MVGCSWKFSSLLSYSSSCTSLYLNRMESLCHFQFSHEDWTSFTFLSWTESFCRVYFSVWRMGQREQYRVLLWCLFDFEISHSRWTRPGRDEFGPPAPLFLTLPPGLHLFWNGPNFSAVSISHTKNGMEQSALCELDRLFCRFHYSIWRKEQREHFRVLWCVCLTSNSCIQAGRDTLGWSWVFSSSSFVSSCSSRPLLFSELDLIWPPCSFSMWKWSRWGITVYCVWFTFPGLDQILLPFPIFYMKNGKEQRGSITEYSLVSASSRILTFKLDETW